MKTNKELLRIAINQLGKGGSKFRSYVGQGGSWCDMFVYWLYNANGNGSLLTWKGNQKYFCPASIQWCRKNLAQIPLYLAMPCDLIYFDWDKNGRPNHIGIVEKRRNASSIYTIEGNTNGGRVAKKTRTKYVQAVFRPHFVPKDLKKKRLNEKDDTFEYLSIYNLQIALGMKPTGILTKETVKCLQRKVGATPDAIWGNDTSRKIQKKLCGFSGKAIDGKFGSKSILAFKKWINKVNFPVKTSTSKTKTSTSKTKTTTKKTTVKKMTNQQKLINKMKELAWAYGTAKKKYDYKTGHPKDVCKKAMKKYGWADNRAEMSDCGNFVSTVVRETGINKTFKALHGIKKAFPKSEKGFKLVLSGRKIPSGFLKPGDIIRYKKKNGKQHAMFYFGDGKVCEASHHSVFGVIRKDTKRYNTQSKVKTIQVFRVKES